VLPGEAAFFRRDTWHHAFNQSSEPLRVLELFAPPPSQGTSGAYSRTKPILAACSHTQDQYLGRWPMARAEAAPAHTIQVLRESDLMWRLEGEAAKTLVGLWISTEHLTVGQIELMPGQHTELHTHGGDESLYLLSGTLHVHTPAMPGRAGSSLARATAFTSRRACPHQYYNVSAEPARLLFAVRRAICRRRLDGGPRAMGDWAGRGRDENRRGAGEPAGGRPARPAAPCPPGRSGAGKRCWTMPWAWRASCWRPRPIWV
jgi:quercetin dioxygenase-like cupin family protein